jgi:hypothetical protein
MAELRRPSASARRVAEQRRKARNLAAKQDGSIKLEPGMCVKVTLVRLIDPDTDARMDSLRSQPALPRQSLDKAIGAPWNALGDRGKHSGNALGYGAFVIGMLNCPVLIFGRRRRTI